MKCATKANATKKHCPETGIHHIEDTDDFLCEKCYITWKQINKNSPIVNDAMFENNKRYFSLLKDVID